MKSFTLVLTLIISSSILSHRSIHDNLPRNTECLKDVAPTPISWHLHVIYDPMDREAAYEVRRKAAEYLGINLNSSYYGCKDLIFLKNSDIASSNH